MPLFHSPYRGDRQPSGSGDDVFESLLEQGPTQQRPHCLQSHRSRRRLVGGFFLADFVTEFVLILMIFVQILLFLIKCVYFVYI